MFTKTLRCAFVAPVRALPREYRGFFTWKSPPCPAMRPRPVISCLSHPDKGINSRNRVPGFPKLGILTIMENQMEKEMENEMETGIMYKNSAPAPTRSFVRITDKAS